MHHNKKKRRRKVQFLSKKLSIAIEHVFRSIVRTMFCTADREAISVLQRAGIIFCRKMKVHSGAKRSSMLCVFIYKRDLCFVKYLYDFEINLMNGTELLIFILLVCK